MGESLPQNAIASLTIAGLATDSNHNPRLLTLHKGSSLPAKTVAYDPGVKYLNPGGPINIPSRLPPPGTHHLDLRLTQKLGYGRVGSVWSVASAASSSSSSPSLLPPLVMKIAHFGRNDNIAREAWFYEDMESLQGIAIPRCYGFFEGPLEKELLVADDSYYERGADRNPDVFPDDENDDEEDYYTTESVVIHEDARRRRAALGKELVSILLLERLGDAYLPLGPTLSEEDTQDIYALYHSLAHLGIEHIDIRHSNLISAPPSPPALPTLVAPWHHQPHHWRIIDFDISRKSNASAEFTEMQNSGWVKRLMYNLAHGSTIEPYLD